MNRNFNGGGGVGESALAERFGGSMMPNPKEGLGMERKAEDVVERSDDPDTIGTNKGKSCKGCLYYSSILKSNQRNPLCVGVSRALPQVPNYVIGESEMEASKEGRSLAEYKYACLGYSVYLDNDTPAGQGDQAELPFCVGIELLVDKRAANTELHPSHVNSNTKEDGHVFSQPRTYKPLHSIGVEFLNRFTRNASLVASGVARNLYRVGNYMKENLDDMLYPYRRRPK